MKKRTREITVSGKDYVWLTDEKIWPELIIKVWIEGEKNKPYIVHETTGPLQITPKYIRTLIEEKIQENTL